MAICFSDSKSVTSTAPEETARVRDDVRYACFNRDANLSERAWFMILEVPFLAGADYLHCSNTSRYDVA